MPDETAGWDVDAADAALDRELRELGPLMRRQDAVEAQAPDPAFARELRARLIRGPDTQRIEPDPAFARELRERLVGDAASGGSARSVPVPALFMLARVRPRRRPLVWAGLAAALVAVLAAVVLLLPRALPPTGHQPGGASVALGRAPQPSLGDLTRGFQQPPGAGGGGGGGGAIVSPVRGFIQLPPSPERFYGPLRMTVGALPSAPSILTGYRLAAPLDRASVKRLARRLGIAARVTRVAGQDAIWNVAADGSGSLSLVTKHPLHSLAVSTVTGEIIYHDLRSYMFAGARPLDRAGTIAVARAWLALFGWRGMRVRAAVPYAGPLEWRVEVDWPGIGAATTPGATVLIVPGGHVVEAHLWPRVAARLTIQARSVRDALAALRANRVPLSITESNGLDMAVTGGRGTLTHLEVVQVLTADVDGRLYLVPVYRFSGAAQLVAATGPRLQPHPAPIAATWYALVPATAGQGQ